MIYRLSLACALALAALSAHAQVTTVPDAEDLRTLECVKKPAAPPTYYHEGRDSLRERTGVVRVQLRFTVPDRPPEVTLLAQTANDKTLDGAMAYVQAYRLPCMKAGAAPLTAVQEFVFEPSDAPAERPLRVFLPDAEASERCVVMPRMEDQMVVNRLDRRQYGKVFVRVAFQGGPEDAPVVSLRHSDASGAFTQGVLDYVATYRMPCRKAGDRPQTLEQGFVMNPRGGQHARFTHKEASLADFLRSVQGIEDARLHFDFKGMGCPFVVNWRLMQPTLPNGTYVAGPANPNRSEFLAWLAGVQLKMPERKIKQLLGDGFKIHVPCGVLNLPGPAAAAQAQ